MFRSRNCFFCGEGEGTVGNFSGHMREREGLVHSRSDCTRSAFSPLLNMYTQHSVHFFPLFSTGFPVLPGCHGHFLRETVVEGLS